MLRTQGKQDTNPIWKFFSSVRLTLVLLIILATASIAGTLIPQQEGAVEFARGLSPGLFSLFRSLNLFDMYHSTWFRILIALLALNLIVCSLNRLPATLRLVRALPRADRSKPFENLPSHRRFSLKEEPDLVREGVSRFLHRHYNRVETKSTSRGDFFYGEKGRYSYFGVYLVHFSVLFILVGGIIGSLFGFEAYVNIAEGETVDAVSVRNKMSPVKLGFSIQCKKFVVDFYENGTPKEFRSDLRFLNGDRVEREASLLVNHPVKFRGITFYQSSYGKVPGKVHLKIARVESQREVWDVEVEQGEAATLPGSNARIRILEVDENLRGMMGPAAMISVEHEEGEAIRFWVFQYVEALRKRFPPNMFKAPILNPSSFEPYTFFLEKLENRYYTGLQVSRDPGVPLVWIGCFLMVGGFFVTFFTSHRRIWVWVSKSGGKLSVRVAGRANKNPVGLERELDQATSRLQNLLSAGGEKI